MSFPAVKFALLGATLMAAPLAQAAKVPVYFGAASGQATAKDFSTSDFDDSSFTQSSDDNSSTPLRLYLGASLLENLSVEAGLNSPLAETRMDAQSNGCCYYGSPGPVHYDGTINGIDVAAIGKLPLNESFHIGGKLGVLMWDRDQTFSYQIPAVGGGTRTYTESGDVQKPRGKLKEGGTDVFLGFLLQHNWQRVALRGELTRYTVQDLDVDVFSVSLLYWFQPSTAVAP